MRSSLPTSDLSWALFGFCVNLSMLEGATVEVVVEVIVVEVVVAGVCGQ